MPIAQTHRALQNCFALELDGFGTSTWKTVSGLEATLEVVDDPTVDKKGAWTIHRYPGQVNYSDITLTRGFGDLDIVNWFTDVVVKGNADSSNRKNGSVTVYLPDLQTKVATWDFTGAWPLSVTSSDVSTKSSELMIETLTLVVETLRRVQ
jgi:phage tail-like protein